MGGILRSWVIWSNLSYKYITLKTEYLEKSKNEGEMIMMLVWWGEDGHVVNSLSIYRVPAMWSFSTSQWWTQYSVQHYKKSAIIILL